MSEKPSHAPTAQESREVAEASREKEWKSPSFLKELYLGNFRLDLIHPYPEEGCDRPEFVKYYEDLKALLARVDSAELERLGDYPQDLIGELKRLGAFGMKIPKEYGGLGFKQAEYDKVMKLLGSVDGNITALLSAHQSIGVPQPLKVFGTEEQKRKYLPRLAAGAISGFALTEPVVGSDPATVGTTVELTPEGDAYILNGQKLWCTNGTFAELLVVMAKHPGTRKMSAFVVETAWEGVSLEQHCRFMGLKALSNALLRFKDVRVPKENRIGEEGMGLKIALVTLNTGRLAVPAACAGTSKICLEIVRRWGNERVQWGAPIGKHEAISHKIADMAATTFAMEAITDLSSRLADRGGYDIRLEAAAAKEWNSFYGYRIVDDTLQIRGGRGYETETSLAARGEAAIPVERMLRDSRINRIFEGSSEIMHLFMAREAVDKHIHVAGAIIDPKKPMSAKLAALPGVAAFYAAWYPTRWIGWSRWPRYADFGPLAKHLRFVERGARKLARNTFHGMVVFGPKLERKQAYLFRIVDLGLDLFAMAATVARARRYRMENHPEADHAYELADLFCRSTRRRVKTTFRELWSNDDDRKVAVSREVLNGELAWLEEGSLGLEKLTSKKDIPAKEAEEPVAMLASVRSGMARS